jgi:hypothetical protein
MRDSRERGCLTNAQKDKPMNLIRTSTVTADRIERAMRIYEANLVRSVGKATYVVRSESSNAYYIVNSLGCTCPDAIERRMICKHAWACYIGAVLTIWRMQMATSISEVEQVASAYQTTAPVGIHRTIQLERDLAIARITKGN